VTIWAAAAAIYGAVLAVASIALPVQRRTLATTACIAYAVAAIASGTLPPTLGVALFAPAVLLLAGYWLSGFFFRDPQPWLERFLIASDARVFAALDLNRRLARSPRWLLELLEASYTADYAVIAAGAFIAAAHGVGALGGYWSLILVSELACYGALPWLRSRPPRVLEGPGVLDTRRGVLRQLNVAILDRASVQANTLPSGHVAGAVAAALAVLPLNGEAGVALLAAAALIALAAVAGRYHYVVDCVAGAAVAVAAASLL
jgi:membrane-associated phospholipid phosphatase